MTMQSLPSLFRIIALLYVVDAFRPHISFPSRPTSLLLRQSAASDATTASFIDTELRGAAMKLHTREQAPKEGQAPSSKPPQKPHVTTHDDYLRFLVDSQHVYQALEDIVNEREELKIFRNTGLERTAALETDIAFMVNEYKLKQPAVGSFGQDYAAFLRQVESIPEFVCH